MKKNVGNIERWLRVIAGIALIALAATSTIGWWGILALYLWSQVCCRFVLFIPCWVLEKIKMANKT